MKPDKHQVPVADTASMIAQTFAKLIEQAPEGGDSGEGVSMPSRASVGLVRESNGWGRKYVEPIPLTGDRWMAVFADAKQAVAAKGIVAFLGDRGPGKTQMAAEIARGGDWPLDDSEWIGRETISKTALYRRAMDIFLDLRAAFKSDSGTTEKEVIRRLETPGLLVIDEFQERGDSDWENRIITNLIDKRYAAERPTILIANYTREEMSRVLSPSVRDRMHEGGRSFLFDWPSFRRNKP